MRYPLCPRVKSLARLIDGELVVELFEGLSFPARASAHTIHDVLLPLKADAQCVVYEQVEEDSSRLVVVGPAGETYAIVFNAPGDQLMTLVELSPEATARWQAAAN